uniref:FAR1 domain-containing protein n=1 Tax=Oryza meridionalis TaxID=40149 RepID=A0A0E0D2V6_9ORYZ
MMLLVGLQCVSNIISIHQIEIKTAPADFRFPTTNQTRHCFTRYIEYHRCVNAKGEATADCEKFAKYYRSLCPAEWVRSDIMSLSYVSLEDQEEYKMMGTVVFSSEEEGYKFYLDYAKGKGFSVRKNNLKRKDGDIIWRQFVCSCEGY